MKEPALILAKLLVTASSILVAQTSAQDGVIGGVVVKKGRQEPVAGAEVVLRAAVDGQFAPVAETVTDADGKFRFDTLPVGREYLYLPGANRDGVHYPGSRVRLVPGRSAVGVKLEVCEAVHEPSPLVIRRHDVVIRPEPGKLTVSETLVVDNPTMTCYVGPQDPDPVTLQLSIPSDFEQVTFDQESFGRNFSLAGGKLTTDIPWTPGERELKLTYVLRNSESHRVWERPLDLPCEHIRVSVRTDSPDEISCNLTSRAVAGSGQVVFESSGASLPAGHAVRVELGRLPVSFMAYAPWVAVAVLIGLIGAATLITMKGHRLNKTQAGRDRHPAQPTDTPRLASRKREPSGKRKGKRRTTARKAA
jgi:hypothetical protein